MTKIFVLEDDEYILDLVSIALKKKEYEVISASDGVKAVSVITSMQPDIVLLDVMTPKMNGLQLCEELNKNESTKNIPRIMMTASEKYDLENLAKKYNIRYLLKKPFTIKELLNIIQEILDIPKSSL